MVQLGGEVPLHFVGIDEDLAFHFGSGADGSLKGNNQHGAAFVEAGLPHGLIAVHRSGHIDHLIVIKLAGTCEYVSLLLQVADRGDGISAKGAIDSPNSADIQCCRGNCRDK